MDNYPVNYCHEMAKTGRLYDKTPPPPENISNAGETPDAIRKKSFCGIWMESCRYNGGRNGSGSTDPEIGAERLSISNPSTIPAAAI